MATQNQLSAEDASAASRLTRAIRVAEKAWEDAGMPGVNPGYAQDTSRIAIARLAETALLHLL